MSSREFSAEELRKLANYLSQQANDLEMTLEDVKKVAVSSQEIADKAETLSKMRENANYLANSV
ncbi:hypothetical protein IFO72_00965 [Streptococcus macedonicus]|nr:hypothetical protein [Streptococcus macedonicus]MBF6976010.1 hypothetical protein [Streptococcus macedonicus]